MNIIWHSEIEHLYSNSQKRETAGIVRLSEPTTTIAIVVFWKQAVFFRVYARSLRGLIHAQRRQVSEDLWLHVESVGFLPIENIN